MHGHCIGCIRVSSFDRNPERQLEHVPVDRTEQLSQFPALTAAHSALVYDFIRFVR